jgi:hypothetical protein
MSEQLTWIPISALDKVLSAGAVESSAIFDFESSFSSKMRYKTPIASIKAPPNML